MRIMVTGGAGFIGSYTVAALEARGDDVCILDDFSNARQDAPPSKAQVIRADICDEDTVIAALEGCDACLHLAAQPAVEACTLDPVGTSRVNTLGAVAVGKAAGEVAARSGRVLPVVFASSAAVYGAPASRKPVREDDPCAPISIYGAQKLGAEIALAALAHTSPIAVTNLRIFNVFGLGQDPRSPYSGVISKFLACAEAGVAPTVFGAGDQVRDFIAVQDVVRAMLAALRPAGEPGSRTINVAGGRETSILELAHMISDLADQQGGVTHGPARIGDIAYSRADVTAAAETLGFRAQISVEEGLRALLASQTQKIKAS